MDRRIFVTGANGRVGLPLLRRLVADGWSVAGLVRDEDKARLVREAGAEPIVGDLEDDAALDRGLAGARAVMHLAGGLRGPGAMTADRLNHQGTRRLVDAVRRAGAELDALLFTSSVAIYGDRSGLWCPEDMPGHPNTRYGASKLAAEKALLDAHEAEGLPVRIVRLAAVYGPGFPFTLAEPIRRGRAFLPGEGRNYVPTIHVEDAVGGILRVLEAGGDGEIYNLADPEPVPLRDFYAIVHEHVGGRPVRFWSTWIPSYVQMGVARRVEALGARLGRTPRFTPDNLKLFTASVRVRVDRMADELEFEWRYPTAREGLAATFAGA